MVTFTFFIIKLYENFFKLLIIEKILQIYDIALKMEKKGEEMSPSDIFLLLQHHFL
ncbi:hypothetical protein HMPREF9421_0219 [Streptococcus australis ATCC 700641]|uniref:Uncharacterized protein n=1 Tax=Streptococcus australis ATCC 700641 TaxID=888833 RepID=E7S7V2_9STRE|nr:hypothetical protein HMPREF9421_0219 [Streptococcus australis ATCC 700641]